MTKINSHKDLVVWQKAMDLSIEVYRLTSEFPATETYRMTSQVTRSVVSVPANIAEGRARSTRKDFAHFLAIAQGSLAETETYLLLAIRLKYITPSQATPALGLIDEVGRMLTTFRGRMSPRT
ncbi:MAG: four helix bundle protein [Chloroflexi bacterium]|nr:four helix bundle protein [Chloroflexota bacterium]